MQRDKNKCKHCKDREFRSVDDARASIFHDDSGREESCRNLIPIKIIQSSRCGVSPWKNKSGI